MSSYQNVQESQIQGYNDCPVLDYSKKNSSTTSLRSRRRVVSQNASSSSLNLSTPPTTTLNSPTPIPKPPSSISPQRPPISKKSSEITPDAEGSISENSISDGDLLEKLQNVLSLSNSLPEREFQHYSKRLVDQFTKGLTNESHKGVVWKNLENYQKKEQVKNELIQFMLSNGGVSTWCLPLRKVLENIVL